MATEVAAHSLFSGPDRGLLENVVLRHDNGVITSISEGAPPATGPRSLVLPAFVNAHDHARPTASSFGALGMPLESWILRSALGTPVDPYLTAASALARSARAGCAAMMIHYTRPSGTMPLVEEAKAIARAASDVGIRIAFALAVRDQNPVVYGDERTGALRPLQRRPQDDRGTVRPRADVAEGLYRTDGRDCRRPSPGPKVDVQLGPAGVQWCSKPLLEAVAENSAQTGRRIHMHLLETVYQRAWADQHFPRRHRPLSPRHRLPVGAADAGALHPRPARRNRDDRGVRRAHRHQFQFQSASALRARADRRRAPMRLRHRGRRRRAGARRGRRRAARDAAGADDARRPRLQAHLDDFRIPRPRHRQRPQGDRRAGNRRAGIWRTSRFRHHRSRSARSRPDHAGRRHRPSVRARQCVAAARCGCGWTD